MKGIKYPYIKNYHQKFEGLLSIKLIQENLDKSFYIRNLYLVRIEERKGSGVGTYKYLLHN